MVQFGFLWQKYPFFKYLQMRYLYFNWYFNQFQIHNMLNLFDLQGFTERPFSIFLKKVLA